MKRRNSYESYGRIKFGTFDWQQIEKENSDRASKTGEYIPKQIKSKTKGLEVDNFSLMFSKFVPIIDAEKVKDGRENIKKMNKYVGGESKKYFLEGIAEKFRASEFKIDDQSILALIRERIKAQKKALEKQDYEVLIDDTFTTRSRLVVGLGSEHVLETSLTLHHIFGIPYIPASAQKGLCRMVAFWRLAEAKSDEEIKGFKNIFYDSKIDFENEDDQLMKYKILFGTQGFQGLLEFIDSFPTIEHKSDLENNIDTIFELDVMNVHYGNYYTKNMPPDDGQAPNPIFFLTVKSGIGFCFTVLYDKMRAGLLKCSEKPKIKTFIENWEADNYLKLKEEIMGILNCALGEFGIGAKTGLGYGMMS
ncbi:MAG: type III-B CRISPR module RAMP protein Cmr6 [Tepidanaerobacteraceae bacterium]|nr:type III-B CRISPR module RAMP protein Cmr6 [Tepidanaerobacteraceae bacterium]